MKEIIGVITNQGFAIGIATYVIVKLNPTIQENTKALTSLYELIKGGDTNVKRD